MHKELISEFLISHTKRILEIFVLYTQRVIWSFSFLIQKTDSRNLYSNEPDLCEERELQCLCEGCFFPVSVLEHALKRIDEGSSLHRDS
mgnify:CR=1 FL=1